MASTINLSLTNELREFIDQHCGDHGLYATPSEFIRSLLREKKEREEAAAIREAIIDGCQDAIEDRTIEFTGSLDKVMKEFDQREKQGWK
ncbi:MAG: hypothetical protein AAGK14_09495 [Verrucomicrobiota bacterium]